MTISAGPVSQIEHTTPDFFRQNPILPKNGSELACPRLQK